MKVSAWRNHTDITMLLQFPQILIFIGKLLWTFKGSCGFFLRHTQSGQCIAAERAEQKNCSDWYWAVMVDNCLENNTNFRYLNDNMLHNIATGRNLARYQSNSTYTNRLVLYDSNNLNRTNSSNCRLRQTTAVPLFLYDDILQSCVQPNGKYLINEHKCQNGEESNFIFGAVTHFGNTMKDVHCPSIQHMAIKKANYGSFDNKGSLKTAEGCSAIASCRVKLLCNGKRYCNLTIDGKILQEQYCNKRKRLGKALYIEYTCVNRYSSPIYAGPKIRLSNLPNQGYLQIHNGSTWINVSESSWSKKKQRMLCQHLGFAQPEKNHGKVVDFGPNEHEIATGDLVCYKESTESKEIGCCINLAPSTPSSTVKIPYVECKVCKDADETIYYGNVGNIPNQYNFRDDKFGENGWCTQNGEENHLSLDLKKEYHITRIVTMDNRGGVGKYTFTCSRNKNFEKKKEKKISGNMDGKAVRNSKMYNVRYIKIQSQEQNDFCLRIQLCGRAQKPAPVQNVRIERHSYSATVNFSIETSPNASSYITCLAIYLNHTEIYKFKRQKSYIIDIKKLKPHVRYSIEIVAQDDSSQNTSAVHYFTTKEAAPSGPPLNVQFISRGRKRLTLTWLDPEENKQNGKIIGYQVCYQKLQHVEFRPSCTGIITTKSYEFVRLDPSTKYFATVAALTRGYVGVKSQKISYITHGVALSPAAQSSKSLTVTIKKQASYIREIIVIVQKATGERKQVENIKTNNLKPYNQLKPQDPYITAYFTNPENLTLVIGDGKEYRHEETIYHNQELRPNTSYVVFLRCFEAERKAYYSTKWSNNVVTFPEPRGPSGSPLQIAFESRTNNSLKLSWEEPAKGKTGYQVTGEPGKITGYRVCFSTSKYANKATCRGTINMSYTFIGLQPSTKYFVTVAAQNSFALGKESRMFENITNGDAVNPFVNSSTSLTLFIKKQANYIEELIVIVKNATGEKKSVENIKTSDLNSYGNLLNSNNPYIAIRVTADVLPLTLVIGDGNKYDKIYHNQPLEPNSSYIVFVRYFEDERKNYYSTEWSTKVTTFPKPQAPIDLKVKSIAPKSYNISWSQPALPVNQNHLKYHARYNASWKPSRRLNVSIEMRSVNVDVEYNEKYMFEIQAETDIEKSYWTSKSWTSHSEPLVLKKEGDNSYKVTLKKPKTEMKTVALVILQLQSESTKPVSPEYIKLENQRPLRMKDVAFIAKEFNASEFQVVRTKNITLQMFESSHEKQKKRNVPEIYQLAPGVAYRCAQMNTDESNTRFWSYWSESFTFNKVEDIGSDGNHDKNENDDVDSHGSDNGDVKKRKNEAENGGESLGAILGASIAAVVIAVTLILAFVFFRRRRTHKRQGDKETRSKINLDEMKTFEFEIHLRVADEDDQLVDEIEDECLRANVTDEKFEKRQSPVPIEEFASYVKKLKAKENYEFHKEYVALPNIMERSCEVAKKPFNKEKNRYRDIVTYDHSRVVLSGAEDTDYINASYIDGIEVNAYIASQGPKKSTVNDMWRMVWEQRTYSIVMVTSIFELGKAKCEKYWPEKGSEMFGDIKVTLLKTEEFAHYVVHALQIKKDDEEREVRHFHFLSWPDHGVPKYPTHLLAFRRLFRTYHLDESGPCVVHCSAGVGRTGVFLAIDTILEQFEKGIINSIDVFGQVYAMRERRMKMVQTLEQYIFIYEAILETILCGMNEVDSFKVRKEAKILAEVRASGMTGFQEKFKRLGGVTPKLKKEECSTALRKGNAKKNRNKNVYPAESNRVPLQYVEGVEDSDYINAVFVHGYLGQNYFIATQSPLTSTINDFWQMVHCHRSSTIVLLSNVKNGTSYPKFWPDDRGRPTQYGSLTVQLDSERECDGIWARKFILSSHQELSDGRVVNIFHYTKWPVRRVPSKGDGVISLMSLVEQSRKNHGQGPVIVTCSDGTGRTGTYIAISNLLERMKIEQTMDVFQTIKIIRAIRPQFVETAEQYQFCYTAIMTYLDSFDEYANFEKE